jgi:hypothetical protein
MACLELGCRSAASRWRYQSRSILRQSTRLISCRFRCWCIRLFARLPECLEIRRYGCRGTSVELRRDLRNQRYPRHEACMSGKPLRITSIPCFHASRPRIWRGSPARFMMKSGVSMAAQMSGDSRLNALKALRINSTFPSLGPLILFSVASTTGPGARMSRHVGDLRASAPPGDPSTGSSCW